MGDFSAILNPCRDPLKNFDIDISCILQDYLRLLATLNVEHENDDTSFNFAEAAIVIQNSTSVYGKKVEHLHHLAHELVQNLHNERRKVQNTEPDAGKGRDGLLSGKHSTEFISLDDIKVSNNLMLSEESQKKGGFLRMSFVPLALLPLDETEKGKVMLQNTKGEILGNKKDFQLNLCRLHKSGCLLLPTVNFALLCFDNDITVPNPVFFNKPIELEEQTTTTDQCNYVFETCDTVSETPVDSPAERPSSPILAAADDSISLQTGTSLLNNIPHKTDPSRRSTRQAIEAQKITEAKMKQMELQLKAWANTPCEIPEFKQKILKKKHLKLPKKISKKNNRNKVTTTITFCSKNFFSNELVFKKKLNCLNVNGAFTDLAYENCKKEQEILLADKKKTNSSENQLDCEEEPRGEQVSDDDSGFDYAVEHEATGSNTEDAIANSLPSLPFEDLSYEDLVQKHLENYISEVAQFSQTTELSEKVTKWEETIKPVLEKENERESFNVLSYGTRVMDKFEDNNRKQTLSFCTLCEGKESWEISRYFLATLQLANHNNLAISSSVNESGTEDIDLTLLSRKRHHKDLESFGHTNSQHS